MNIPFDAKTVKIMYQTSELPRFTIGEDDGVRRRTSITVDPIPESWRETPEMRYEVTETFTKPE